MKIYLSCNGLGLGHVGRSLAFAEMLKKRGDEVIFASWGPAVDFARKQGYKCYNLPAIDWHDKKNGDFDFFMTSVNMPLTILSTMKIYRQEKINIEKEKPDIVISDSSPMCHIVAKKMKIPSVFLSHQITFKQSIEPINKILNHITKKIALHADKVCINDIPAPNNIYPYSTLNNKKAVYIGPLLRKSPLNNCKPNRTNKKKFCFILISGPKRSPYALEKNIRLIEKDLQKLTDWYFIIKTPSIQEKKGNIEYVQWVDDVFEYLSKCDVFISRSGYSTVCDILAYAKKSILIPQVNQTEQEMIAEYMNKKNLALGLKQSDIKKIPLLLESIYQNDKMQENLDAFSTIINKHNGSKKMVEVIDELVTGN
ncbi:MAG: UDP-N-acetylglucosamine--N-acetylmuramyl-(pentapeptide) pyrophosphoryl-undecaprenol N-acetylglucosamine transferase [Candidatus Aenigmarchaeota archaeon]|nr:UDP-N-acetylglucosamine--N-acetylmuramyl-(pentapeptide) pyrophosphoryl-undecaprenol N-acetylglucosamine transferase [Candidatus Aenigmarchaeota archaeon]